MDTPVTLRADAAAPAGRMADAIRTHDWAATALGPREAWPVSLRTLVDVMLGTAQPTFLVWGPRRILLYNDAFAPALGARHPGALGRRMDEVWPERTPELQELMARAYAGEPSELRDVTLVVTRNGQPEEAHFAYSYAPVRDEQGEIAGVFCPCRETTEEVFERRRQSLRMELDSRLRDLTRAPEIIAVAESLLGAWLGASRVGYGEVDFEGRYFTTENNWTDGSVPHQAGTHDLAAFGPEIHQALRSGETLAVHDAAADPRVNDPASLAAFQALDIGAVLTVSLVKDGRMRAALYVHSRRPRRWTPAEVAMAEEVADRTWSAIERARAEAEVADVLDSIREGFVLLDRQLRVLRVNGEAERLQGRPAADMVGRTAWELWPDMQGGPAGELFRRAVAGGESGEVQHHRPGADGRDAWLELRAYPSALGLAVFFRDVTERRLADQRLRRLAAELQESEERLRIAQRAGRVGAFELLPQSGRILVSEEFCRLWGVPIQPEYVTADLLDQILPEDRRRIGTGGSTIGNETLDYIEYRIRRADTGELRWMARRGEVLVDAQGRTRLLGVSYDITDRKTAELALKELNETLEAQVAERTAERDRMWRLSTDVMLVADFEARIVAVNPAWTSLFGWREDELIGQAFLDFLHPDDLQATLEEVGKLAHGITTLRFENRYRNKDGGWRWLSWTAVPDEGFIHAVGRDVEGEKRAAAELEAAQAALRQAQKMEAVGQLTGGIAHDFNNLLTGVLGSLDLLTRRVQQGRIGDIDRYVTAATKSASRAAALTQRLLAFSRRQPLAPKPVDANRLVLGMDELLRRTLGERIALELVSAGGLWTTRCDPHQLESAILNLAINSRDAMPDGGRLVVETCNAHLDNAYAARERQVKPGQYVCICVSDTGGGIPSDILDRVIEPFFTTKPLGQGTGLGLSMIYGFAQQSEGYLKIYSQPGQGTTVKLYLPRWYGEAEDPGEAAHAPIAAPRPSRDEVVLVVEDEDTVRDLVVEVLQEVGCTTLEAFDGPSGLQLLQSDRRVDLLVTDVGLPGLNGRQLADAARTVRPDLRVLFMTGYAENAAVASGFLEPGMEMITKPFAVADLAARIREILDAARG